MRRITLTLLFRDGITPVAELSWIPCRTQIVSARDTIRADLERLVEDGLSEWMGPYEDPTSRRTPSSDPLFLERLAEYLRRQFNFTLLLQDSGSVERLDEPQWPQSRVRSVRDCAEAA